MLYLHGGGWTLGGIEGSARFCGDFAKETGIDVATLDYRLAPEHQAPAALQDALAAVGLLQARGYRRIYLSGDSAGGNLAAAAAWKLRSEIAGTVLYYPVVLAKNDASESWKKFGGGFGLDGALMDAFNESYAPGKLADDPMVSPLLATEFDGYPETLIVAAECDVLFDQGRAFGERLEEHGIRVEHRIVPGALHAFMTYPNMEQAYRTGLQAAVEFIIKLERKNMNAVTPESIVRLSEVTVDPARLSEYLAFVTECGRRSMAEEPGVLLMYSMQDKAQPERITILEIYADRTAYEHHIQTPHFQKYKQGTLKMVRKLELLDQTPLVPEMKMK
ncbi:MAG: alpha/beta hydrolase fold domain-containing protein [Lentisphaeria bacterium]|nr:alpha/beta hydrolase fold domain-containing protein [Lentisphaeria bacterium]